MRPVREVAVLVRADEAHVTEALRAALRSLPPTATRLSVECLPLPTNGLTWEQETDLYPHDYITRTYYGQPSVTIMGRLKPTFDEQRAIYVQPLTPTTYRRQVERASQRQVRFTREAWAEVERLVPTDA